MFEMNRLLLWFLISLTMFLVWRFMQESKKFEGFLSVYYTAGIPLSIEMFTGIILILMTIAGGLATRIFGHWILGGLTGLITLGFSLQIVWNRSIEQNRKLDMELPYFIGLIRNSFLATNGNDRFALEYAASHITSPSLRIPFSILVTRWKEGAELQEEAEKIKGLFQNKLVWHLLDAIIQEHYGGGSFIRDLDRLTERAKDRFRLAEMRKVATASSVYSLYGIMAMNLLLIIIAAVVDPDGIRLFRELTLGKIIIGISLVGYSAILFLVFRLIRLGDKV